MQVVVNKCFLLNPENYLAQICLVVFETHAHLHPKYLRKQGDIEKEQPRFKSSTEAKL